MKLTIRTRHLLLTPEILEAVRHRIDLAFERIRPAIRAVDVTLADINGPRGGADKQCRLRVRARGGSAVVVEHVGTDTLAVVATAVARAEQVLLRKVARRRAPVPALAW